MESLRVDAIVIGAGPGGYVAGIRLGQLGKKALVVERDKAGGVCLNVGCIPSKALINAAKLYEKIAHGADLGILADNPRVDMAKLQSWKDGVVGKLSAGVRQLLKANGCDWRSGSARLLSPGRVEIQGSGPDAGKTIQVEAAHIVIATGARPVQIPGFAFDGIRVLDSTGCARLDRGAAAPGRDRRRLHRHGDRHALRQAGQSGDLRRGPAQHFVRQRA